MMLLFAHAWRTVTVGKVPMPIKKQPAKDRLCDLLTMRMSQPAAATVKANIKKNPRMRRRSDKVPIVMVDTATHTYTGMVMA